MNSVFRQHLLEYLEADLAIHRGLHGVGIEELAALHAEALLEYVLRIGRGAEESGAVDLRRHLVGDELADLVELFPVLWRRKLVAELGLERVLHLRIVEDVLPVIEQHHVAIVREAINLPVILHLVVG
nr:hypothetical protein [Bradyrhizobium zhanjiangense]